MTIRATIFNRVLLCGMLFIVLFGVMLSAARAQGQLSTEGIRESETEVGNLVADAIRQAAAAEIAFVPAAAFRQRASTARPATSEGLASLLDSPTDNIVILSVRGAQILSALERAISFAPQPSSGFLQVSGIKFSFNSRGDGGKRVVSVTVGGSAPLDAARIYKVATTLPLANGQQGYFQIWDKEQITSRTNRTLIDSLTEFARGRGGTLSGSVEGRIVAEGKSR